MTVIVVRRAWDRERATAVAVKLTADVGAHDPRRHRREIDALTRVRHPGLVALHDGGVDGPTLAERILLDGPLTPDGTRRLGVRVAAALAAVHAAGIVHRDVKPANVLLEPDGTPRLTDFGIARALDATSVTRTGAVLGTAAFLAPEQVRGHDVTGAADVYALGPVLLEAVTSAIPVWRRAATAHRPLLMGAAALAVLTGAVGSVLLGGPPGAVPAAPAVVIPAPEPSPAAQEPPPGSDTDARPAAVAVAVEEVPTPSTAAPDLAEARDEEPVDDGKTGRRGNPTRRSPAVPAARTVPVAGRTVAARTDPRHDPCRRA